MKKNDNRAQHFSIQIRTTYADLLERLEELNAGNAMASLTSCTLITKAVKGGKYLYAQGRLSDGSQRQVYLCPFDDRGKAQKDLQESHELQQILRQLDHEALDEAFDAARSKGHRPTVPLGALNMRPPRPLTPVQGNLDYGGGKRPFKVCPCSTVVRRNVPVLRSVLALVPPR